MTDAERACAAAREQERLEAGLRGDQLPAGMGDYVRWTVSYKVQGWIVGEGVIGKQVPAWRLWNPIFETYQEVPKEDVIGYG